MPEMTQEEKVMQYLSDRRWHHVRSIINYVVPDGVNVACRSRISALNKKLRDQGLEIISRRANGTKEHEYRLAKIGELPL